jgi:hypothetical protein
VILGVTINDALNLHLMQGRDDVAIAHAKRFVDGHDVELWQPNRKVTKLAHQAGPNKIG